MMLRDSQAKLEKARQQYATLQVEYNKIVNDFEEFKTRARTVLKQKQETDSSHESLMRLRDEVLFGSCHLSLAQDFFFQLELKFALLKLFFAMILQANCIASRPS